MVKKLYLFEPKNICHLQLPHHLSSQKHQKMKCLTSRWSWLSGGSISKAHLLSTLHFFIQWYFSFFLWDKMVLCSQGWLQTHKHLPTLTSPGVKALAGQGYKTIANRILVRGRRMLKLLLATTRKGLSQPYFNNKSLTSPHAHRTPRHRLTTRLALFQHTISHCIHYIGIRCLWLLSELRPLVLANQ